jgi:predicted transposase/invertase (TIGR01784 family)
LYYLDPKNDISFKKVFGQHPDVLISFLNALLPIPPENPIVDIEYLNNELLPELIGLKNSLVDIRCRDKQGRQFLVEMQMIWTDSFKSRILYNTCKAFSRQINKGDAFGMLAPVYSLNIVNQAFSKQQQVWYHHYRLSHQTLADSFIDGVEIILVELANFIPATMQARKLTALWLRFLKEIENRTTMIHEDLLEVPEIAQAVEALKESSYSLEELEQYEKYWDVVRTQKAFVQDALTKGIEQGIGIGIEQGVEKNATKVVENLIGKTGFSDEQIADIAGVTVAFVATIRQKLRGE